MRFYFSVLRTPYYLVLDVSVVQPVAPDNNVQVLKTVILSDFLGLKMHLVSSYL